MPGNDPPPDRILVGSVGGTPVECRFVVKLSVTLAAEAGEAYRAELEALLTAALPVEVSVSVST